jgi:hypothetical protein
MTASSIFVPFGFAQSNGTGTMAHWNCLPSPSQLVHQIPAFARPGRAVVAAADGVLSDTAMRHGNSRNRADPKKMTAARDTPGHHAPLGPKIN